MANFKKRYNLKIMSVLISAIFLFNSTLYALGGLLRVPVEERKRINEAIKKSQPQFLERSFQILTETGEISCYVTEVKDYDRIKETLDIWFSLEEKGHSDMGLWRQRTSLDPKGILLKLVSGGEILGVAFFYKNYHKHGKNPRYFVDKIDISKKYKPDNFRKIFITKIIEISLNDPDIKDVVAVDGEKVIYREEAQNLLRIARDKIVNSSDMPIEIERILREIEFKWFTLTYFKEKEPTKYRDYKIQQSVYLYILRLELLEALKILKGNVFYPSMGNDFFPSYFANVFGTNTKTGLGSSNMKFEHLRNELLDLEREAIGKGLPYNYMRKKKKLHVFSNNSFDYESYFPELLERGGIDVLFIKGLTDNIILSEEKRIVHSEAGDLVLKVINDLLNEGGFIVIAHKDDLWLADFIKEKLKYPELLKQASYERVDEVLSRSAYEQREYLGRTGTVSIVGPTPIIIFQKPYSTIPLEGIVNIGNSRDKL